MKESNVQLLIIGGGAAGMSAATAAVERGVKVLVAEARSAIGGNGLFPRGIFGVDSVIQRQKLTFADKDEIFRECMEYSHWKIDGRIIRTLIDRSGDTISWLMGKGVEFCDVVHHIPNQMPEVFHITKTEENVGRAVIRALKKYCDENGAIILPKCKGDRLLLDDAGRITGSVCINENGEEITIHAEKTILCTGGFSGNREMIKKYYPNFKPDEVAEGGGMRHPGDGVRMALEAGADVEGNFAMEIAAPKIKGYEALNLLLGKPTNIWLNRFGRRFADEGIVYNFAQAANACMRQPGGKVWVVFNEQNKEQILADGRDMIELIHIPLGAEDKLEATIKQACQDGIMCKADSIEELAAFIGCDSDTLLEEMNSYEQFCQSGRDAVFAKRQRYLHSMAQGPYYAIAAGSDMLITHGGIRVNEKFQALNSKYQVCENLYVAGVDFGGADADVYNVNMSGHGFGFAVNSGRIAGEAASAEILKN